MVVAAVYGFTADDGLSLLPGERLSSGGYEDVVGSLVFRVCGGALECSRAGGSGYMESPCSVWRVEIHVGAGVGFMDGRVSASAEEAFGSGPEVHAALAWYSAFRAYVGGGSWCWLVGAG